MNRSFYIMLSVALSCLLSVPGSAQFTDPWWSIGAGGKGFFGQTANSASKPQMGGYAFVRAGLVPHLQGELSVGFGQLAGRDITPYKAVVIPVSLRMLYSPWELEYVNLYAYAGAGAVSFKGEAVAGGPTFVTTVKSEDFAAFFPGGGGLQVRLSDDLLLEASGGYNLTLNDNVDYYFKNGGKGRDGFWSATLGITVALESGSADPDGDGLANSLEKKLGTDPHNPDTDGDGLSDGDEYRRYGTRAIFADTDEDGLSDAEEINLYKTNPVKIDSDEDGLSDGDEVRKYKTNPMRADTDNDGLHDGDEVEKYKTDPLVADTDRGTVIDGVEVARGTDPLNRADDVPKKEVKVGKRVVLEGIVFKSGSAALAPGSAAKLDGVYAVLRDNPEIKVEISGHTDNRGSRSANIELSFARAYAVKTFLVTRGIEAPRIRTNGYGPDRPIAPNTIEEGRAKNRRIEFMILE